MIVNAFTSQYNVIARTLVNEIGISAPIITTQPIPRNHPSIIRMKALWDTGATNSVITTATVTTLNISPTGVTQVNHAGGQSNQNVYLVNIYLPNNIVIPGVRVTEAPDTVGSFGAIIGMDIISLGDFAVTNFNGKTMFSFRIPSISEIYFVKTLPKPQPATSSKIGRNDPCYCESGKKYKYCHGK